MKWPRLALAALVLFHVAINIVWEVRNLAPPWWDQAGYLLGNLRLLREYESGGGRMLLAAFVAIQDRSPLFNAVAVPFFAIFGENETAGMVVVWGAFVLLLIIVYKIGAHYGGEMVGVLAALVTSCMPLLYGLSRQFLVEVPLATVAAGLADMGIRAEGLKKRKPAVLFGVWLGLGLLLKVTFIVYGAGVLAGIMFQRLRERKTRSLWGKRVIWDLLWGVVPALAIGALWYLPNYETVIRLIIDQGYGRIAKLFAGSGLKSYYCYLINYGVSAYLFSTGCIALAAYLFRPTQSHKRLEGPSEVFPAVLVSWFLLPLVVFSLAVNPDARYLTPALPAFGVLISLWLSRLFRKNQFILFMGIYSILPLYCVLHFSFSDAATELRVGPLVFTGRDNHYVYRPVRGDWKNEEVLSQLQTFVKNNKRQVNVALLADERYFEPNWFNFLSLQKRAGISFFGIPWFDPHFSLDTLTQLIVECDLVISKSEDSERSDAHINHIYRYNSQVRELLQNGDVPFVKISDHIVLPDGSRVLIYQRAGKLPDPLSMRAVETSESQL